MKTNMRKKLAAFWLIIAVTMPAFTASATVMPFEPWSRVGGYWIAADGKNTIRGAIERGVSIGKYQNRAGSINWKQISLDDVSFVMVRLGSMDDQDSFFDANMRSAESVGLKIGVIFYGKPETAEDARKEARHVLDVVKEYRVSYPIGYDISGLKLQEKGMTRKQITNLVNEFCEVIENAGYRAAVFGDQDWLTKCVDVSSIPYDVWYNRYGMANTFQNRTLWRCTDLGKIKGIPGNVCLEFSFEDYSKSFDADGWREINGVFYYFNDYKMVRSATIKIEDEYYFFDRNGISIEVE